MMNETIEVESTSSNIVTNFRPIINLDKSKKYEMLLV